MSEKMESVGESEVTDTKGDNVNNTPKIKSDRMNWNGETDNQNPHNKPSKGGKKKKKKKEKTPEKNSDDQKRVKAKSKNFSKDVIENSSLPVLDQLKKNPNTQRPKLIMSVVGDAVKYVPKSWPTHRLKEALVHTMSTFKETWVFTGCKNTFRSRSVTNLAKEAIIDFKTLYKNESTYMVDFLPKEQVKTTNSCDVYDVKEESWDEDMSQIEYELSSSVYTSTVQLKHLKVEMDMKMPVVLIIAEGDADTINYVVRSLQKNIPIVLVKGTGMATDFIWHCLENEKSERIQGPLQLGTCFDGDKLRILEANVELIRNKYWMFSTFDIENDTPGKLSEVIKNAILRNWSHTERDKVATAQPTTTEMTTTQVTPTTASTTTTTLTPTIKHPEPMTEIPNPKTPTKTTNKPEKIPTCSSIAASLLTKVQSTNMTPPDPLAQPQKFGGGVQDGSAQTTQAEVTEQIPKIQSTNMTPSDQSTQPEESGKGVQPGSAQTTQAEGTGQRNDTNGSTKKNICCFPKSNTVAPLNGMDNESTKKNNKKEEKRDFILETTYSCCRCRSSGSNEEHRKELQSPLPSPIEFYLLYQIRNTEKLSSVTPNGMHIELLMVALVNGNYEIVATLLEEAAEELDKLDFSFLYDKTDQKIKKLLRIEDRGKPEDSIEDRGKPEDSNIKDFVAERIRKIIRCYQVVPKDDSEVGNTVEGDLLLWAVLNNQKEMAELIWKRTSHPILTALIASAVLKKMSRKADHNKYESLCLDLKEHARVFSQRAIDVTDRLYEEDPDLAIKCVTKLLPKVWGISTSCIAFAQQYRLYNFVAHHVAQKGYNRIWYGGNDKDRKRDIYKAKLYTLMRTIFNKDHGMKYVPVKNCTPQENHEICIM